MTLTNKDRMTVAAHRGDSYNYFENTMTAFKMALENGADMIETDVRLSKDGYAVLIHDDTVNRTTNGNGKVCDLTLNQLRELNAGNALAPEKIPTFEEFIAWASKTELTLNIELKEYYNEENGARCVKCIEDVIALVEKYGMAERVVLNSFDAWILEYVYKKYGKKYLLHGFYPYSIMGNVSISPDEYLYCACIFDDGNKELYDYLIKNGIEPWIGASVTQGQRLKLCYQYGAKLVTTNNPRDAKRKLGLIKEEE